VATVRVIYQAERDLLAVLAYFDAVSPSYARVFEDTLLEVLRRLERFPRSGRTVPEIDDPAVREILHRGFRIVYFVDALDSEVEVLTLIHSSRPLGGAGLQPGSEE
jgi:toxin ParE1/3/4